MKILKLLEGLYKELKTYNEYIALIEKDKLQTISPQYFLSPFDWIKYQLKLKKIKLVDIAKKTNRTKTTVSSVLNSKRESAHIKSAVAELLGYKSWQHLLEDAEKNIKKADN